MVNLFNSKMFQPQPFSYWLQNKTWECHVWRVGLKSRIMRAVPHCHWIPRNFGTPFTYQSQGHWRDVQKGPCLWLNTRSPSRPSVCTMGWNRRAWHVPQSPVSHPIPWYIETGQTLGIEGWDMGLCGTSQVIPSHPMRLIGIAATVPGTFGIPNVPIDICWQCWTCVHTLTQADSGWRTHCTGQGL